jgi:toxin ParE1/3/4
MSYKVYISNGAKHDVREARLYYNQQQPGLGKKFIDDFREKVKLLEKYPFNSSVVYNQKIFTSLKKFRHYVIVSVHEKEKAVIIWAVPHQMDNPKKWP